MGGLSVLHETSLVLLCVLVTLANLPIQFDLDFFIFMYILNILFVWFWHWWVFVAVQASSFARGWGCARAAGCGFPLWERLLLQSWDLGHVVLGSRGGARWVLPASSAQAQ